jgi:hypothetical protein
MSRQRGRARWFMELVRSWGVERGSSLYRLFGRGLGGMGGSLRWRISLTDRHAARGFVAPAGAKGWLRVSMCQIASLSLRARSTWATFGPRCLPSLVFVRW